jgi:hypothetical protein
VSGVLAAVKPVLALSVQGCQLFLGHGG